VVGIGVLMEDGTNVNAYPEAACKPNPRDPPVTTTTLPSSEKIFLKSLSWTSHCAMFAVKSI